MSTELNEIHWNLVTKRVHGHELLRKKLGEKIAKFEKHLVHFPEGSVHLHIALERQARKPLFIAALTLRVPTNILHAEKSALDIITAFDDAVRALLRELRAFKARLRREATWKKRSRRAQLHERKTIGFAALPQPEGKGPQELKDVVCDLLAQHYARLLRHTRRLVEHETLAGELTDGTIDPRSVVAETARRALAEFSDKPQDLGWLVWFHRLILEELHCRREALAEKKTVEVSLDMRQRLPEDAEAAAGYDVEPLDIIEGKLSSPVIETRDLLPDPRIPPPNQIIEQRDLLEHIQHAVQQWPRSEREVFELHFVEGFELDEIAMILRQPVKEVRATITSLQRSLRAEFFEQAEHGMGRPRCSMEPL